MSQGYDHVLFIEDRFSKFCCLYLITGKETVTVAKKLENLITRFGCPVIWGTDNGGEFKSKLVYALCRSLRIKK
jgi:transposase InsO family protein